MATNGPRAIGVVVDRVRDQLLAGAGLALDQDGGVGGRDAADHLVDLLHRRRAPDDQLVRAA